MILKNAGMCCVTTESQNLIGLVSEVSIVYITVFLSYEMPYSDKSTVNSTNIYSFEV